MVEFPLGGSSFVIKPRTVETHVQLSCRRWRLAFHLFSQKKGGGHHVRFRIVIYLYDDTLFGHYPGNDQER